MDSQHNPLPHGFKSAEEFQDFGARLRFGLPEGIEPLFQGSSVTGLSYKTGKPFDVGRQSDFDLGLVGRELFRRGRALGLKVKEGTRIGPLSDAQLDALGLLGLRDELSKLSGRPVKFMLFDGLESALRRPSIWVP